MAKNPRLIQLSGQTFGMWKVHEQAGNTPRGGSLWRCTCECGVERIVHGADLRYGKSTGCGCIWRGRLGDLKRSHGDTGQRLYLTWKNMHRRCRDTEDKDYGGRGIAVCPQWSAYEKFREWAMRSGYTDDLTIDRIDNDKGYYPANCRWADAKTQARNRRFVQRTSDGRLGPEVAEENGIPIRTYNVRRQAGWSVDQAATWPYNTDRKVRERLPNGTFAPK